MRSSFLLFLLLRTPPMVIERLGQRTAWCVVRGGSILCSVRKKKWKKRLGCILFAQNLFYENGCDVVVTIVRLCHCMPVAILQMSGWELTILLFSAIMRCRLHALQYAILEWTLDSIICCMQFCSEGLTVLYAILEQRLREELNEVKYQEVDFLWIILKRKKGNCSSSMIKFVSSSTRGISSEGKISRVS